MKRKGFTLIELLVVIAIIGLLSTLAVVSLNGARGKARDAAKQSDLNAIATAMELYNVEEGEYPGLSTTCGVNILADSDNNDLCYGQIVSTTVSVVLQSIPEPPDVGAVGSDDNYKGFSDGNNFCISAMLENDTDFFKCTNGSCFVETGGDHCANAAG